MSVNQDDPAVQKLYKMGFPLKDVAAALKRYEGHFGFALEFLLQNENKDASAKQKQPSKAPAPSKQAQPQQPRHEIRNLSQLDDCVSLRSEMNQTKQENEALKAATNELKTKTLFLDEQLLRVEKEHKQTCARLQNELIKCRQEQKEKDTEIESLRQRWQQKEQALKAEINELKTKTLFLDEELLRVEKEHKQTRQELERLKRINNIDTTRYLQWTSDDVVDWIMSLENGVFAEYEQTIRVSFKEEQVTGSAIHMLDKYELRGLGIKGLPHRNLLMEHIEKLVTQNQKQPNNGNEENAAPMAYGGSGNIEGNVKKTEYI